MDIVYVEMGYIKRFELVKDGERGIETHGRTIPDRGFEYTTFKLGVTLSQRPTPENHPQTQYFRGESNYLSSEIFSRIVSPKPGKKGEDRENGPLLCRRERRSLVSLFRGRVFSLVRGVVCDLDGHENKT